MMTINDFINKYCPPADKLKAAMKQMNVIVILLFTLVILLFIEGNHKQAVAQTSARNYCCHIV